MTTRRFALLAASALALPLQAQTFAPIHGGHFPGSDQLVPPHFEDLVAGDLDGDGAPELLALGGGVWVLGNDGSGGFVPQQALYGTHSGFRRGVLADTDGDGDLDLLASEGMDRPFASNTGTLAQFENRGGVLVDVTAQRMPVSDLIHGELVAFDHDGDGDLDLAASPITSGQLMLLDNDGTGRFALSSAQRLPPGLPFLVAHLLVACDLDGDADLDLVATPRTGGLPMYAGLWLRNDGSGRFTEATASLPSPASPIWGVIDVDRDGDPDLLRPAEVHLNDGFGAFVSRPLGTTLPWSQVVRAADLDGDGREDLVTASLDYNSPLPSVYIALPDGRFELRPEWIPADLRTAQALLYDYGYWVGASALAVIDVDGDARPDVLHAGWKGHTSSWTVGLPPKVLLNQGGVVLRDGARRAIPMLENDTYGIASGDLDGDGDPDLVLGEQHDRLFWNRGDGTFEIGDALPGTWGFQQGRCVDLDGDSDLDFVRAGANLNIPRVGAFEIYLQQAGGTWSTAALPALPYFVHAFDTGDVDGDGDLDLALGCFDNMSAPSRLWSNDGAAGFTDTTAGRMPAAPRATAAVWLRDLDGDADLDLVELEHRAFGGTLRVSINDGTGRFTDETGARVPAMAPATSIAALDDDRDGDVDLLLDGRTLRNDSGGFFTAVPNALGRFHHVVEFDGTGTWTTLLGATDEVVIGGTNYRWSHGSEHVALPVDVDLDGDLDVVGAANVGMQRYHFSRIPGVLVNLRRQLVARRLLRLGHPWVLALHSEGASAQAILLVGAEALAPRLEMAPFGALGVDPRTAFALATSVGTSSAPHEISLAVPREPALLDARVFAQALVVPPSGLFDARLTGVASDRITW